MRKSLTEDARKRSQYLKAFLRVCNTPEVQNVLHDEYSDHHYLVPLWNTNEVAAASKGGKMYRVMWTHFDYATHQAHIFILKEFYDEIKQNFTQAFYDIQDGTPDPHWNCLLYTSPSPRDS